MNINKKNKTLIIAASVIALAGLAGAINYYLADRVSSVPAVEEVQVKPRAFDYYVLALSWSPHYCMRAPDDAQQCSTGRNLGFVLHGLWPQYEKGYPENCSTARLPSSIKPRTKDIYPNDRLYFHEWYKHGTCSGLKPNDYWELSHTLFKRMVIPANYAKPTRTFRATATELKDAFKQSNPALDASAIALKCSSNGKFLQELYVCLDKAGQPRTCSEELLKRSEKSCRRSHFLIRNAR